ncbi:NAD(P)/FAD-dependent oxidoreductase [Mycolicibacterium monacense]|uniref:Dehydrogenase n=1 Tax=Mycolicibacterium monacense TaxID=85693 RepID=A0AAD1ISA6_MYCMB|nr:FAD-dependent oxidoreductase [Mycolicibacterium monacense]MDA4102763.1 FAD-dependent pyridine nucleotide-disulfide oxidoreductase [Mycolicibacterium monacense DSM 44395]ORB15431.1 FAD-dependent oxidoreductase [Mycolicibacterium monacense DSM 44395]QHP87993.1 FAD-dependent oxidoreductase [Mycolicibacterium monacense DSM 44395]BBZ58802.1 dehydrogenase [Mycolicibacterium monacense]
MTEARTHRTRRGQKTHVVVIGGGYAGVMAANHLRLDDDVAVTLINPRPQFVERIRLHQLVTGSDDSVVDYDTVLGDGITLVVDAADHIDAAARRVELASGTTLDYDYLIYAVGSTGAALTVPGAAEFAHPISEYEHGEPLRAALAAAAGDAPIVVVGAGPTGMEVAAELAEGGRRVTLVCGSVLGPYLSTAGRRTAAKRFARLGVTVLDGPDAVVAAVHPDAVTLADGRRVPSAVTVWTAGFGVPDLAARSGLTTDRIGRLLTDETLTSVDDDRIVAAGDASAPSDLPLRMSCQAAIPLGAQAANTVLSRIAGTEPKAINQAFTGQCISLGRDAGLIQIAHLDDRAMRLHIGGRLAASIKEQVCRGTISFLSREARKPGSYFWLKGGKRRQRLAEALPVR